MNTLIDKGIGLYILSIFGLFNQAFQKIPLVTGEIETPLVGKLYPSTSPGTSIERPTNPNIVGLDVLGNLVGPTGQVFGQDAAMKIAISAPGSAGAPTPIGYGVHGERDIGNSTNTNAPPQVATPISQGSVQRWIR